MVLLFLSVWAIVIALNEVLFAAQPFSMTSIAAAMPHTLMFSVVLSAAVYIAKKRIIDAVNKGRPIDKRFVAELTPEVGHQLNSMRRKLEAMDGGKGKSVGKKVKGKNKGRNFPSDSELSHAHKEQAKLNQEAYDRIYEKQVRNEQLKEQKEKAKAQARARVQQGNRAQQYDESMSERESVTTGVVGDPNDFVKEAHAQMMEQAQERMDAAKRQRTAQELQEQRKSAPSMVESRARLAKEKELQKERREAQIDALGAISQQERAVEEARRAQEKAAAQARAQERAEAAAKAEAEAKAQARAQAQARAEAAAKEKAEQERRAMAKVRELAAAKERAAIAARERKEQEAHARKAQEMQMRKLQEAQMRKAQARKVQEEQARKVQEEQARKAQEAQMRKAQHLEHLQEQAKNIKSINLDAPKKVAHQQEIDFIDQIEIPKGGLDTSSLRPYQMPKSGAGLDTSALKKVTLNKEHSPERLSSKMLNTSGNTLSNANLSKKVTAKGKDKLSVKEGAMAMQTTLQNDSALPRGQANTLELAHYQANARARALAQAQSPKAQSPAVKKLSRSSAKRAVPNNAIAKSVVPNNKQAPVKQGPIGLGTTLSGMPQASYSASDVPEVLVQAEQVLPKNNIDSLKRAGNNSEASRNADLMHAQENANTYMQMQSQATPHHKGHRARPSQLLQVNESSNPS